MLKISTSDIIQAPVNDVFRVARDELPSLVPYLPNISKIETKEKKTPAEGVQEFVNHWYAKVEIPAVAAKFIKPDLLSWKDIARWSDAERRVDYRLESFVANDLFKAKGTNKFEDAGNGTTRLTVLCEVEIYPEKVPGVPRLLAATVKGPVEELIRKMLEPNLTSLSKGLNSYFGGKKSK